MRLTTSTVLCAAIAAPCFAGNDSYRYEGRLGYRNVNGAFVPVSPESILVGWGEGGCRRDAQSAERIGVYPDATIQLSISPHFTHTITLEGGDAGVPDVVEWPCYRFQVRGCDDAVVRFGPEPPSGTIEMQCPGREARPRVDG